MLSKLDLPSEWTAIPLGDLVHIVFSSVDKHMRDGELPVALCNYMHVLRNDHITDNTVLDNGTVDAAELQRYRLFQGDVVVTKDSEDRFDIAKPTVVLSSREDLVCGYHLAILRPKPRTLHPDVLAAALRLPAVRHELAVRCNGVTRFGLSLHDLRDTRIPLPPPSVLRAAVEFAATHAHFELALASQIAQKRLYLNALMQRLLTGQLRLAAFAGTPWCRTRLGGLFRNRREPGRRGLPTLSVTMHNGLVKRDTLDRRIGDGLSEHEHLLVRPGDIAYNMMRMWQGASGMAMTMGNISPAYVVLEPRDSIDSLFASYWFKSARMIYLFWAFSYGLTGDRLRLYAKDFSMIPVTLPSSLDEQRAIAGVLDTAQCEIKLLKQLHDQILKQKHGLMQKLLTGQIRIPQEKH